MQDEETKTEIPDYTPSVETEQPEIQPETHQESTKEPETKIYRMNGYGLKTKRIKSILTHWARK